MKYYLLFVSIFISSIYGRAQNNQVTLPESLHLPSKAEIARQLSEQLEDEKRIRKRKIITSFRPTDYVKLNDSIINTLVPIIFVKIYPDTLDNDILKTEVMDDDIVLWSSEGYHYSWYKSPKQFNKYNLNHIGTVGKAAKIKDEINSMLPREYLFSFFPIKNNRWRYDYVGYSEDGVLLIKDAQGNTFSNLKDLIIKRYGSIADYVMLYKSEVHKKTTTVGNWNTIVGVKEFYRCTFGKEIPIDIEDAIKRKDMVFAQINKYHENEKIVFISDYKHDENGVLWYYYYVPETTNHGWILADKVTPIN
jgi:hypothetical protein